MPDRVIVAREARHSSATGGEVCLEVGGMFGHRLRLPWFVAHRAYPTMQVGDRFMLVRRRRPGAGAVAIEGRANGRARVFFGPDQSAELCAGGVRALGIRKLATRTVRWYRLEKIS